MNDQELLASYARQGDHGAFAELVGRHGGWVGAMALRLTRHRATAEDVTQAVFMVFARRAASVRTESRLSSWLFAVTRHCARNALRNEATRRARELEAAAMRTQVDQSQAPAWTEIVPLLDELVAKLGAADQQAVLLRFYQQKTFVQIAESMRISEEAARKRVTRAVDRLRRRFAGRGVAVGATALAAVLSESLVPAAPVAAAAILTPGAAPLAKGVAASLWLALHPIAVAAAFIIALAATALALLQLAPPPKQAAAGPADAAPIDAPTTAPVAADVYFGRLLNEDDKPIAGAKVWRFVVHQPGNREEVIATTTTDADGRFQYPVMSQWSQTFIQADDYAYTGGEIKSRYADDPTEICALPAAKLRVRFIDPDGKPAAGIRVELAGCGESRNGWREDILPEFNQSQAQTADADGVCTFANIPRGGIAWVNVLDDRYAEVGFPQWMTLSDEDVTQADDIHLERGAEISGQVVFAADGKPAAGVEVVAHSNPTYHSGQTFTDENGRYTLKALHADKYYVFLFLSDQMMQQCAAAALKVDAAAGQKATDQNFTLVPGGIVQGRITEKDSGKPLAGFDVFVSGPSRPLETMWNQDVKSDTDGRYMIHVPPGSGQVQLMMPLPPGYADPEKMSQKVEVTDGGSVDVDYQVPAKPVRTTTGRVVDPDGHAVANADIYVRRDPEEGWYNVETTSDGQGNFTISAVDHDTRIRVRKGRWSTLRQVTPNGSDIVIELHPDALASIHLIVQERGGSPIAGAKIELRDSSRGYVSARVTSADGSCTFRSIPPDDSYSVAVSAKGFGYVEQSEPIRAGKLVEEPAIVLRKADSFVSGTVVDENGLPIAGASIAAGTNSVLTEHATSDAQGHFRIEQIVPGTTLTVVARESGGTGVQRNVKAGSSDLVITVKAPAAR